MSDDPDGCDPVDRRGFIRTAGIAGAMLVGTGGCATASSPSPSVLGTGGHRSSRIPFFNVTEFGARGDGQTNDHAALEAALVAGAGTKIVVPAGTYRFDSTLVIPERTHVELFPGVTLECRVRGGASGVTLANGSKLYSVGGATIVAHESCHIDSLITNRAHDGTQEYGHLEGLTVLAATHATISIALVNLVALFVNSGVRDCVIVGNRTAPVGLRVAGGANTGFGPVYVNDVWVTSCTHHNIVITEHDPHRGSASCWLTNVTSEHPGPGGHALYLEGHGGLYNVTVRNFHYENGGAGDVMSAGIYVDGVPGFSLDGGDFLSAPIANKTGIVITKNPLNFRFQIRNVQNINAIDPIIDDQQNGKTFGARSIGFYEAADPGRSSGNVDQAFVHLVQMSGGIATLTKAGPLSDADFPPGAAIPDGTLAVDTLNSSLLVRVGGHWKSVALK